MDYAYTSFCMHTYTTQNHTNLFLRCSGRGPTHWYVGSGRSQAGAIHYKQLLLQHHACRTLQCTQTLSMKKRLTPHVFVCIYKLLYTYVYPYKYVPRRPREGSRALGAAWRP